MMFGADLEDLRRLAAEFQKASERLRNEAAAVGPLLMQSPWQGPDKEQFAGAWSNHLAPQLRGVAIELEQVSQRVLKNREEQERTSTGDSGVAGAVAGAHASGMNNSKDGLTPAQKEAQWKKEHAQLANASYRGEHAKNLPPGWTEIKGDELRKLGLSQKDLGLDGDGFNASIFRNAEGKYVLAFAGTDPSDWRDWVRNAAGGYFGLATDYDAQAVVAAMKFKAALNAAGVADEDMTLTGHSLGGRLATVGSHATGLDTYTFNPAGTSFLASYFAAKTQEYVYDKTPVRGEIDNTIHIADPLNYLQTVIPKLAEPIGERNYVIHKSRTEDLSWGEALLEYHSTEPLIQAFDDQIAGKRVAVLNYEPLWEDGGVYDWRDSAKQILKDAALPFAVPPF